MDAVDPTSPDKVSNAFINTIICPTSGKKQEFWYLIADSQTCHTCDNEMYDELGRLAQGNKLNNIKGTNMVYFIHPTTIPKDQLLNTLEL